MKNKHLINIFLVLFYASEFYAQQNVLITDGNTVAPHASSLLELNTSNKGVLIPRVALISTSSQSPIVTVPETSLLVYNTASWNDVLPGYYHWDGTKWVRFDTGNNIGDWKLQGNAGTSPPSAGYGNTVNNNFLGTTDAKDLTFVKQPRKNESFV
jgi:hypothetical protein